jgi:3-oxoacyl-[acyl-carrier protein] reductase
VTESVDEAVAALGGLDILVNNAGVSTSGLVKSFMLPNFDPRSAG